MALQPPPPITIAPMLSVRRSPEALAFYQAAFNATVLLQLGDTSIVAQLAVQGALFWIAEEAPEYLNFSPETLNGATTRIILTVPDPDVVFAQAVAAGATPIHPVTDFDYGWRVGRVQDPYGHHWEIGKPL